MPVFNKEEYLVIYSSLIRVNEYLPFTCYVLLPLAGKVAIYLPSGETATPAKCARLKQFTQEKLYIRSENKAIYLDYLNRFTQDPENLKVLQQDLAMSANPEEMGIPPEALKELGKVQNQSALDPTAGAVVELLKAQSTKLEQDLVLSQTMTEEEKITINGVTLKIEDELIHVTGEIGSDEFRKAVQNITEHIKSEVSRISVDADMNPKAREKYHQLVRGLTSTIEELSKAKDEETLSVKKNQIQSEIQIIRNLTNFKKEEMVSSAIEGLISGIEKTLGQPLNLKLNTVSPTIIEKQVPAEITSENLLGTGKADPQIIDKLKNLISRQEKIITSLTDKLKASVNIYDDLKSKWFTFQMLIKRKIDATDQMKTKAITQQFFEFENQLFKGLNDDRKNLRKLYYHFDFVVSGNSESGDQIHELKSDPDETAIISSMAQKQTDDDSGGDTTPASSSENFDQLLAENNVLKVQLENSQALVETISKKISELEEMLRSGGEYSQSLEEDLLVTKKKLEALLTDSQDHESDKRRLSEGLEDMSTTLYKQKNDQASDAEKLSQLQIRIFELEKSLRLYTDQIGDSTKAADEEVIKKLPRDVQRALFEKDDTIKVLTKKLEAKAEDLAHLKNELESLKSEDRKFELEKKDLSKRIEKQRVEYETLKQLQKSLELKSNASTNLLAQARKTINKISEENEELKIDRTKYIKKTNEALAEHKSLVSQAISLNSQVQVEMEKNRSLENQIENQKQREKEFSKKIQTMTKQLSQLELEKKKLDSELKRSVNQDKESEIEQLKQVKQDLEKRIDLIKSENKTMQDRHVQDQKKITMLEQTSKKRTA